MVYSTSRCPNCGKVIDRKSNPIHELGVPFERCMHCGGTYLNSYKEEWITKSPLKRFFFFLPVYTWARALLAPLMLLAILISELEADISLLKVLWPIGSVLWLVMGYFLHKWLSKEDIKASLNRTKDEKYIELLKKAGYEIYPVDI